MTKTALLVGCNYTNGSLKNQLRGCHNDVNLMRAMLINVFRFKSNNIHVLTDEPGTEKAAMPSSVNIRCLLYHLISQLKDGDVLFFHFSGHGTRFRFNGKLVEAIVPCDSNILTNMDFRMLVDQVPQRASFVLFSDSCHSGGLIDKEKEQIGPNILLRSSTKQSDNYKSRFIPFETLLETLPRTRGLNNGPSDVELEAIMVQTFGNNASLLFRSTRSQSSKLLKSDQGILVSACQSEELAGEYIDSKGHHFGTFTYALQVIIEEKSLPQHITIKQLVMGMREIITKKLLQIQHPCLYCSDENVDRNFLSAAKLISQLQLDRKNQHRREEATRRKVKKRPKPRQQVPILCIIM